GIVLSPGPSHPSTMVNSLGLLKRACGSIPIFGVCLGMQLIGYFLGYGIRRAGRIMHGKKELIRVVSESTILKGLPNEFYAVRYHSLVVDIRDPKRVVALSGSDGEVMAFEFREKLLFGVQFHPESVESEFGDLIAKNFLEVCYGSCTETFKRQ
ncbi:MAG: anthranilate synthase component II, partial [Thermosulfidibacteraceae bacterium]